MKLPTHIYIGPDKSGSTWLYEFARASEDCFVPDCKDIYYFDRYYHRNIAWYSSHFEKNVNEKVSFDISHDYLFSAIAAERIYKDIQDVNLLVFLRDPVERSISQYKYMKKMGVVNSNFSDAIRKFPRIVSNSKYYSHLNHYKKFLDENRLAVFWFDDLRENPVEFCSLLSEYLEIPYPSGFDATQKIRQATESRFPGVTKFLKKVALLMRDMGFENQLGWLKSNRLIESLLFTNATPGQIEIDYSEREKIFNEYFAEEVKALESAFQKDLSHWKY
ncbi:MAG: sulfotransferase domain-containing protein [Pseudomonadota bacterium]|nr:sulfotransferase domain-containing protein [Pseudomonadota bacterium]